MKSSKALSLLAGSAAVVLALMATGSASATVLTGSSGTVLEAGTAVSAAAEGTTILHPAIGDIECHGAELSGKVSAAGGSTETAKVSLEAVTFGECNATVAVLKPGTLEFHTKEANANNNGLLTWNGTELTTEFSGLHCIYGTKENNPVGTFTGSATTKSNATLDIEAKFPRTGGRSGAFCGTEYQWTGAYKFTSPSVINVD